MKRSRARPSGSRKNVDGAGSDFATVLLMRCGLFWMAPLTLLLLAFSGGSAAPPGVPEADDKMGLVVLPVVLMFSVSAFGLAADCVLRSSGVIWILQVIVQSVLLLLFFAWGLHRPEELPAAHVVAASADAHAEGLASLPPSDQVAHTLAPAPPADERAGGLMLRGSERPEAEMSRDELLARPMSTGKMSVVLPCLNESTTAANTVMSFCNRTPSALLEEIIVVDDGSMPPLAEVLQTVIPAHCRLRIQRHKTPTGLMGAKQTGGDHALGEFIGFYDCHVAPRIGWHDQTIRLLREKERRLVIPMIGSLDVTKWDEVPHAGTVGKCYMNWNADWWWYNDDSPYTPVISGGLVATTRNWWRDSGGFDSGMHGWGGENTETAIRVWLCGGDVIRAEDTFVAHMWRTDADKRTVARYKHTQHFDNVARVAAGWFDEFAHKFRNTGPDPSIDVTQVKELQKRLGCKPFVHFLHRFRQIYVGGGLLPEKVFKIRSMTSGKCLQRHAKSYLLVPCGESTWFHYGNQAPAGFPTPQGMEEALSMDAGEDTNRETVCGGHKVMGSCSKCPQGHGSEWCHGDCSWVMGSCIAKAAASRVKFLPERTCCSGLREWNSLDCMEYLRPSGPGTALCDVAGTATGQQYSFQSGGHIRHYSGLCVSEDPAGGQYPQAVGAKCEEAHRFEIVEAFEPEETKIYRESVRKHGLTDDLPDH